MKIVVTGGGTMGHVTPLKQIVSELRERGEVNISYLGNKNKIEKSVADDLDIPFYHISSRGTGGLKKVKNAVEFGIKNSKGILEAIKVLMKIKPDLIVASGGYVTAPVLAAAKFLLIPYVIHEQNRVVGKVNRIFFKDAEMVFGTFEGTLRVPDENKWRVVGNPVKPMDVKKRGQKIVFLGGSGGSDEINSIAFEYAIKHPNESIFVQTGINKKRAMDEKIEKEFLSNIRTFGFTDIEKLYSDAKVVVCRAGSTTICELISLEKPMVLMPFKEAVDNHQYENARYVEDNGMGIIAKNYKQVVKSLEYISDNVERIEGNIIVNKKESPEKEIVDAIFYIVESQ